VCTPVVRSNRAAAARRGAELVHLLPATLTFLRRGEISHLHAMALAEAVHELDDEARAEVEVRALRRAGEQSLAEFPSHGAPGGRVGGRGICR
jgi:hypothetical protein